MYREADMTVLKIYRRIDADIARLQRASGMGCPAGCGHCCANPGVTASIVELLPLSRRLWQRGEVYAALAALEDNGADSQCIFYRPDPCCPEKGCCDMYDVRPLVCRLFGFSFRTSKYGCTELVTCKTIKAFVPDAVQRLERIVAAGSRKSLVRRLTMRSAQLSVARLDPGAGSRLLPVNTAIRCALERTGLALQYDNSCDIRPAVSGAPLEPPENDNDSSPPVKPRECIA
jgi:Fe-S-cluster containining protein